MECIGVFIRRFHSLICGNLLFVCLFSPLFFVFLFFSFFFSFLTLNVVSRNRNRGYCRATIHIMFKTYRDKRMINYKEPVYYYTILGHVNTSNIHRDWKIVTTDYMKIRDNEPSILKYWYYKSNMYHRT